MEKYRYFNHLNVNLLCSCHMFPCDWIRPGLSGWPRIMLMMSPWIQTSREYNGNILELSNVFSSSLQYLKELFFDLIKISHPHDLVHVYPPAEGVHLPHLIDHVEAVDHDAAERALAQGVDVAVPTVNMWRACWSSFMVQHVPHLSAIVFTW